MLCVIIVTNGKCACFSAQVAEQFITAPSDIKRRVGAKATLFCAKKMMEAEQVNEQYFLQTNFTVCFENVACFSNY